MIKITISENENKYTTSYIDDDSIIISKNTKNELQKKFKEKRELIKDEFQKINKNNYHYKDISKNEGYTIKTEKFINIIGNIIQKNIRFPMYELKWALKLLVEVDEETHELFKKDITIPKKLKSRFSSLEQYKKHVLDARHRQFWNPSQNYYEERHKTGNMKYGNIHGEDYIGYYGSIDVLIKTYIEQSLDRWLFEEQKETIKELEKSNKEKDEIIKIYQYEKKKYPNEVKTKEIAKKYYKYKCAITGERWFYELHHILHRSDLIDEGRIDILNDPHNFISLSPLFHKFFNLDLLYIEDDGTLRTTLQGLRMINNEPPRIAEYIQYYLNRKYPNVLEWVSLKYIQEQRKKAIGF